ncbi:hypothetical protein [Anaeromicropila herbilytica]|uniref:Uncharacterized protein n=1 Tax=Anaeromicropila herbilytica TaxID=2785025 RepID=A0A7R7EIS1_9FIRM|nr:hypothetical protein [Anaeromicropila herbilytica]BCN29547.1 hypothetical protein bsdtb5_08420 [Anaeromicropila herbilytica]
MEEKKKKIMATIMWGIGLVIVIIVLVFINGENNTKDNKTKQSVEQKSNVIVHDGSENNPHIEGVQ